MTTRDAVWLRPFELTGRLQPLHWRLHRHVTVGADLFGPGVETQQIRQVFAMMAATPRHTFQVMTEFTGQMRELLALPSFWEQVMFWAGQHPDPDTPSLERTMAELALPNVWLGTQVRDEAAADALLPELLRTPAAVRFLSCVLVGDVDLTRYMPMGYGGDPREEEPFELHWVTVSGESGPKSRPMHPGWVRGLRDRCIDSEIAFRFTGWGDWVETNDPKPGDVWLLPDRYGTQPWKPGDVGAVAGRWGRHEDITVTRVGPRKSGRTLDGEVWDQQPPDGRVW